MSFAAGCGRDMDNLSLKSVSSEDDDVMLEEANVEDAAYNSDSMDVMEDPDSGGKCGSMEDGENYVMEDDPLCAEMGTDSNTDGFEFKDRSDLRITKSNTNLQGLALAVSANNNNNNPTGSKQAKSGLVIVDTKSILCGRGPVPVQSSSATISTKKLDGGQFTPKSLPSFKIPDDAFLIEAPSFIVPYVFEQKGDANLKDTLKELQEVIKKEKEEKGEVYEPAPEKKKTDSEDYFESSVGKLLISVGMNLVQEYVQADLLKMQKKKAEKERQKSRGGFVPMQTQQSIISLKNNLEESKENNEPFRHKLKKCEFCNFKTASELVMATHLETPHMKNYNYRCNFCAYVTRFPHEILFHMETSHKVRPRLERAPAYHQCPNCPYEDNSKAKLSRHVQGCTKRFRIEKNLEPPQDWDTPAKLRLSKNRLPQGLMNLNQAYLYANANQQQRQTYPNPALTKYIGGSQKVNLPPLLQAPRNKPLPGLIRTNPKMVGMGAPSGISSQFNRGLVMRGSNIVLPGQQGLPQSHSIQVNSSQLLSHNATQIKNLKGSSQPSISITPLPRQSSSPHQQNSIQAKPQGKTSFVICEICDGYIKDLDQLRNHMQWIHKVKIHPKMIYNKPPLNCQKCQFRFFTDQGLERHLLGSHGLVTSSMQDAANKGQDNGRCPLCGKIYQWKLLAHVAKDHNVTLKPAHLSYKCTVCTATFGMYKLFESHVYSAHSMNSKRNDNRKPPAPAVANRGNQNQMQVMPRESPAQNSFKPLKINDEITIIPQPASNPTLRNKGALTITPHSSRLRGGEDEGIQIIEIEDSPHRNGRKENGEFKGRLPINDTILRKRNLEISLCGTESDNNSSDESFQQAPAKRLRQN